MDGFFYRWRFPQCCGAIDGTHIPIIAPADHHCDYFNRKHFHSVILQAVVDHKYRFININVGHPGKHHDAYVFKESSLFEYPEQFFPDWKKNILGTNVPLFVIGDPAYPLLPWLMKGYINNIATTEAQQYYNYRLSSARMVVEGAFGRLKGRWRCLLKRYDGEIDFVPNVVTACCVLHNMCEVHNEYFDQAWLTEVENQDRQPLSTTNYDHEHQNDNIVQNAKAIRNTLCEWVQQNR